MKQPRIEPGLLVIFRFYLAVQLVLILLSLMVHHARGLLPGDPEIPLWISVSSVLFMLGYLSWPWLRGKLGRLYLPLALCYAIVYSLVIQDLFLRLPISTETGGGEESAWQLFLFLFVPLALAGWQYGFKAVVAYCALATLLDYALIFQFPSQYSAMRDTFHRLLFIRAFSFLLAGYIISRIMQQMRRERQALQAANDKLERFVSTLERLTIARERNRVARELHDTLAHTLSSVALQLEGVDSIWEKDPAQSRLILRHALAATRDGLTESRKAIQSLRASPLEDLGLADALRAFAEETAGRAGAKLELILAEEKEGWVPAEVEQCFYRIGQEALENIARHAGARHVRVHLARDLTGIRMDVADDGCGFNSAAISGMEHFGLKGMQERAQIIHAVLDLESEPENGARVRLTWQPGSGQGEKPA